MGDAILFVYHLDDFVGAEPTKVKGLAAGGRIESGAVQVNPQTVARPVDDLGLKFS
jgi:hypothetical protein